MTVTQEKRAFIEKTVDKILKEQKLHKFTKKEIIISICILLSSLIVLSTIIMHAVSSTIESKRRVSACLDSEFCTNVIQNLPTVTYHCIQDDKCYKAVLKEAPKINEDNKDESEEGLEESK